MSWDKILQIWHFWGVEKCKETFENELCTRITMQVWKLNCNEYLVQANVIIHTSKV